MKDFFELKKNLKKDYSSFKSIKIDLLGDSATQLLTQSIKAFGFEMSVNFEIYEADYSQIDSLVFDTSSEIYKSKSDFIIIFQSVNKLVSKFYKSEFKTRSSFSNIQTDYNESIVNTIQGNSFKKIIFFTYPEFDDSVYGNYACKTDISFVYQLRKINLHLMDLARKNGNLFIFDLAVLSSEIGYHNITDQKNYINADMVLNLAVLPRVSKNLTEIILAVTGQFKKCAILDLDNTLWGGIIGDDGMEGIQIGDLGIGKAFSELQLWFKQLKERGIILTVCSKNTEHIAKEPFESHPDMVLRLEDIALFVANWENKVDNIRYIQSVLNIGFDSMVFIDDNPFERNMVREGISQIIVPELPEDPVEYLQFLRGLNLFETASFSSEDAARTIQYKEEANRTILQRSFTNETDYLKSLDMKADVKSFDVFSIPRVAQLSQRSNQFNLRTIRYTEDDIKSITISDKHFTFSISLNDKFGDYGLVCILILEKINETDLFIDTWIMSCRVLKRGVENFTLNTLIKLAQNNGFSNIIGEYIPTAKNGIVTDHYKSLGFTPVNKQWIINVSDFTNKQCYIN